MVTDLAQLHERVHETLLLHTNCARRAHVVVHLTLHGAHLAHNDTLHFLGQLCEHLRLKASKQERPQDLRDKT